ncbi:MAG: sigma-70 family RNA polymerase sigma factor [Bacilli bacterium]|nr:sigma-70 family RNA polymerase sigma factor [Bacilli bacterium]
MDYKELNDYELVYQIRENDTVAYNLLMDKYSKLVTKYARKYYLKNKNAGIELDDLYQEGMMGIIMALNDYNSNETIFYTYALLCMRREMERLVKASRRKKQAILNECVSLNIKISDEDDIFLEDLVASNYSVEEDFRGRELVTFLYNLKYYLNDKDSLIYELKLNCFANREIADLLDMSYRYVDNRLRIIRKRLKQRILSFYR